MNDNIQYALGICDAIGDELFNSIGDAAYELVKPIKSALESVVPPGYVLVPIEATDEMCMAGIKTPLDDNDISDGAMMRDMKSVYASMIKPYLKYGV